MRKIFLKQALYGMLFMAVLAGPVQDAAASVTIAPTLVVIEGRSRFAEVNLINTSDKPESYELNWRFFKMQEGSGRYEEAAQSVTPFDLTQNIVFTPRRVTVEPKSAQKVRLGLRLKGEPPAPGDYRAHLEFAQKMDSSSSSRNQEKKRLGAAVKIGVGVSIPVIYRVGDSDAKASIGDISMEINPKTNGIEILVPISRSQSNFSILGRLYVYYNDKVIGEVRNANIFPEISSRTFRIGVTEKNMSGGKLRVVLKDYDLKKDLTLAEKSIPIGK